MTESGDDDADEKGAEVVDDGREMMASDGTFTGPVSRTTTGVLSSMKAHTHHRAPRDPYFTMGMLSFSSSIFKRYFSVFLLLK